MGRVIRDIGSTDLIHHNLLFGKNVNIRILFDNGRIVQELFEGTEHRSNSHVMTVNNCVEVGKVGLIQEVHKDGPGAVPDIFKGVMCVIIVVNATDDRITQL